VLLGDLGIDDDRIDGGEIGKASLSGFGSVTSKVKGSITLNWSALVIEPVRSCALPSTGAGDGAVERPFHVVRRHWRAVLELGVLAQ